MLHVEDWEKYNALAAVLEEFEELAATFPGDGDTLKAGLQHMIEVIIARNE